MKLLYVWIEKFRNIERQGFVVDDEYFVSIESPDEENIEYRDDENRRVIFSGDPSKLFKKKYHRKLNIKVNEGYIRGCKDSTIQSITALVGENASGKSSIIECLHMRAAQLHDTNDEQRYYLLVLIDESHHSLVIRTRDILLIGEEASKRSFTRNNGYEEYVIPLIGSSDHLSTISDYTTCILSVYQQYRQETDYAYSVMGILTLPINLINSNSRNAFLGAFDFLCSFPKLGGENNRLAIFLSDNNIGKESEYFTNDGMKPEEYKTYFIYKAANLLFGKLRDFLYHEKPEFLMSGARIRRPEEEVLHNEDMKCAEMLSFCCFDFPQINIKSLITMHLDSLPKDRISQALSFFKKSTNVHHCKVIYDRYLDALEGLFACLYDVDAEFFTAHYKLEIPFMDQYRSIAISFWNCIKADSYDKNWCDSVVVDFEWLSAGEYQLSMMFSALYQRLNERHEKFESQNLILLLDEPEMHMHPETSRQFIDNLKCALIEFNARGLISHCQIIMATHSPFIIQALSDYNHSVALAKKENNLIKIRDFVHLNQLFLPGRASYSFNLVMYMIFDVPTIELHNELYGVLQEINHCNNIMDRMDKKTEQVVPGIDSWLKATIPLDELVAKQWRPERDGVVEKPQGVTLQTYIRNSIHHPENRHNAEFSKCELQRSIDQMIELL